MALRRRPSCTHRRVTARGADGTLHLAQACSFRSLTLWLLATIVFIIANVLPNDVGRTILGPFAPQESVDALNERLGTNRPILVRYVDSIVGVFTLDFGEVVRHRASRSCPQLARRDRSGRPSSRGWPS